MNKLLKVLIVLFLSGCFSEFYSQRMQWIHGDFSYIINEKEISIAFNYDSLTVNEYKTEKEFLDVMRIKHEKEEEGSGEKWEKSWYEQRSGVFERRFSTLFYKYSGMGEDLHSDNYTLIFKTTHIEMGWNKFTTGIPAYIDGEAWLIKNSEPEHIIAKLAIFLSKGESVVGDYTGGIFLGEAYAVAGRRLGKYVGKLKKDQ